MSRLHSIGTGNRRRLQNVRGSSFLEVQVAAVVMGVVLSGLAPLMVLNTRQAASLREKIPATELFLAPADPWAAKLGQAAAVSDAQVPFEPEQLTYDDGGTGFTTQGSYFYTYTGFSNAYANDMRMFYNASWQTHWAQHELELTPGVYDVYVRWPAYSFLSDDVRYQVYDGSAYLGQQSLNQTQQPSGYVSESMSWSSVGRYTCESGTLRVRVINQHDNTWAMADGVTVAPVLNSVTINTVSKDRLAESIQATVTVTP